MRATFWIGASGLNEHQKALDVIANNVANVNTTSFKSSSIHFQDLFTQTLKLGGATSVGGTTTVNPIQRGYGVTTAAIQKNFNQGTPEMTSRDLDLALMGPGFYIVRMPDAAAAGVGAVDGYYYTRDGHFQLDANGMVAGGAGAAGPTALVTPEGYAVQGVNATINPATGEFELPAGATPSLADIIFDPTGILPAHATDTASFGLNLDSSSNLAIDPLLMTLANQGVDRSARLAFQRAAFDSPTGESFYYFTATETSPQADGSYAPLNHSGTANPIEGVLRLDSQGLVNGVFQKPAGDINDFLDEAEVAALAPWTNTPLVETMTHDATGAINQIYGLHVTPDAAGALTLETSLDGVNWTTWTEVAAFTAAGNEFLYDAASGRITFGSGADAPPARATIRATYTADAARNVFTLGDAPAPAVAGAPAYRPTAAGFVPLTLAAPAAFQLGAATDNPATVAIALNGHDLTAGVDFQVEADNRTITPLTAWAPGAALVTYTAAGALVPNEAHSIANVLGTIDFAIQEGVPPTSVGPIDPGTLTVYANGVALVEDTDYTVNYETGVVTALTPWAPGAVTVDYYEADTRVLVDFARANQQIRFTPADLALGDAVSTTPRPAGEVEAGTTMTAYDNLGNPHALGFSFERISENRWIWSATPTYRFQLEPVAGADAPTITGSPQGGGTNTRDGFSVLPDTLIANSDGTFQMTLQIDEGAGTKPWTQIAPTAAFPLTGDGSYYFKVADPVTGEIALSRDLLNMNPFSLPSTPVGTVAVTSVTAGDGTLLVDGVDYQLSGRSIVPLAEWPNGTGTIVWDVDGTAQTAQSFTTQFPTITTTYDSNTAVGRGILAFDATGGFDAVNAEDQVSPIVFPVDAAGAPLTDPLTGAATLTVAPDFSALTQTFRQSDVTVMEANGFPDGELVAWRFDSEGRMVGEYSNGKTQFLARVALARFANPEGLLGRGETTFLTSASSGAAQLFYGGTMEGTGTAFVPTALETSNVDMSVEFTNMIIFQRAYQFNSRIITATDEMIKEAIGMKR